jgi:hypothetical protein
MNNFYSCSWVQNTKNLPNSAEMLEESIASVLKDTMKKIQAAKSGVPYRDARLFFYQFLQDKYNEKIPQEYKDLGRKLAGKEVNALMGAMMLDETLPKNFIEKIGDEFKKYSDEEVPGTDYDRLKAFLNKEVGGREYRGVAPGGEKRMMKVNNEFVPYKSPDEIKSAITHTYAEKDLKKGSTGYETLTLNLDPTTKFSFESESPMGTPIYVASKNGLKFRVTLKDDHGKDIELKNIGPDAISSVVVTKPTESETVTLPTPNEYDAEAPKIGREKSVADFPNGEHEDWSKGPLDPEDSAYGREEDASEFANKTDMTTTQHTMSASPMNIQSLPHIEIVSIKPHRESVRLSPQAVNKLMREQIRAKQQHVYGTERKYGPGR